MCPVSVVHALAELAKISQGEEDQNSLVNLLCFKANSAAKLIISCVLIFLDPPQGRVSRA